MKDPKAIRKAIMTAKSIASLIDPKFARVPLPDIGLPAPDFVVPEHSTTVHEAYDVPMPQKYAAGGEIEPEHYAAGGEVIKAWRNPSPKALRNLTERSTHGYMRGLHHGSDQFWWDADHAIHHDAAQMLGIPYNYKNRMDSRIDQVSGNYIVGADEGVPDHVVSHYERAAGDDDHYAAGGDVDDGRELNQFGLYSHAAEQAAALPQERGTPEQYRGMLLNRGVKPAELEWSGFDEAFANKPQVTRDELAEHFRTNMPDLFETQYGGRQDYKEWQAMQERHAQETRENALNRGLAELNGREYEGESAHEMHRRHNQERRALHSEPFHEEYSLPGGYNYREILIQNNAFGGFEGVNGHFGGAPDIIASLRMKDRRDQEGDKVLHLDELQSDWAQQGRKKGFAQDNEAKHEAAIQEYNAFLEKLADAEMQRRIEGTKQAIPGIDFSEGSPRLQMLKDIVYNDVYTRPHTAARNADMLDEFGRLRDAYNEAMDAPLSASKIKKSAYVTKTDDWVDLGLKRALLEAAKGDYDKLAWSPGDVHADRYDLSRHIGKIRHEKNEDGTYNLDVFDKHGTRVFDQDDMDPDTLEETVGKEMAEKILAGHGDKDEDPGYRDWRTISGLDLKVGGEGMRKFYDEMLPKRLMKLVKQHDPEVRFSSSTIVHPKEHGDDDYQPDVKTELPALEITPRMRESILKKGFAAYAGGGEVEGYADGGMPDDSYEENPNGGLMFPPEEGAARLQAAQRRDALVASGKKPDVGLPKNPRTVIRAPIAAEGETQLPDFVTGDINFDDWRKRHEKILNDAEIHHSSSWYKNIYGNFLKYYPDPQEAKKMMRAWLVAQQNVSPAGAMNNVLMQQEQMERGDPEHLWRAGGMPNPTAAARAVLRGKTIAGGVGQKISDFVDSAEGKNTRSWMGDHPQGGEPFVVDVHTARDTGMVDQELINHLSRLGYNPEDLKKLKIDLTTSPSEPAYESRGQFGRKLTQYLNNMNWKGRSDWTPAEIQAVGWMGMTKLTRNAEEDSESGLGRNLRRISYELSPGSGSPWEGKYGKAFESLPDEDRYDITQKMADSAIKHAKKLSGIDVQSLVHGTGAWENYQNPAAVAQSLSTQRGADIAAAALGHLLQQTEVWHNRVKPIGASPKGFALDFIERGSKNLADPNALKDFWEKVMEADPHGIVKGYQPITLPTGETGLRALFDKGGKKTQEAIESLLAPHQTDEDGNVVQQNPFRAMLESHPFDLDIIGHEAEITKHRNDWSKQKNGEGYISRLVDLLGHDPSASLNSARQQLEKEFEQHLDKAHQKRGTSWRKAYGGALMPRKIVYSAIDVIGKNNPRTGMAVRRALMIAKNEKKK